MATSQYHHGDLKAAILDAAEEMLAETPLDTVSMRELARNAGVSSGAPYHHFGDRSGLILALCQRGFSRLGETLRCARDCEGIEGMIGRYLTFAQDNQALYQLMFSVEATSGGRAASLAPYAGPVFVLLEEEIAHARDTIPKHEGDLTTVSVWCFMHGLASLSVASPLQAKLDRVSLHEFACKTVAKLFEDRD